MMIALALMAVLMFANVGYSREFKTEDSLRIPNLSVEMSEQDQISTLPLRTERLRAFEKWNFVGAFSHLDELDQDLYYFREKKSGRTVPESLPETFSPEQRSQISRGQHKKKTILFFDTNFAPAEIKAAREVARHRGEDFLLFPERSEQQQKDIETDYLNLLKIKKQYEKCFNSPEARCETQLEKLEKANELFKDRIRDIKPLSSINDIFADLASKGIELSAVIFSGHSSGKSFMGVFGQVSLEQFQHVLKSYPNLFSTLRSVLLWGCYTGTLANLANSWQTVLPSATAIVGYRNQAPAGIKPASGRLLQSYLLKENDFITAPSISAGHRIFRSLDLVANLDATALHNENYFAYDRAARISDLIKLCDKFDPQLFQSYQCYNQGQTGCEHPPENHQGSLRKLYSFLQVNRHCDDILVEKFKDLPTADTVIRLIYIDHIKANFAKHHSRSFKVYNDLQQALELPAQLRIENYIHSKRAEDVQLERLTQSEFVRLNMHDGTYLETPKWHPMMRLWQSQWAKNRILELNNFRIPFSCTPFSWVEADSSERDSCGFDNFLMNPLPVYQEELLVEYRYQELYFGSSRSILANPFQLEFANFRELNALKDEYFRILNLEIQYLESTTSRTARQEQWLQNFKQLLSQRKDLNSKRFAELLLEDFSQLLLLIDGLITTAKTESYPDLAIKSLERHHASFTDKSEILQQWISSSSY